MSYNKRQAATSGMSSTRFNQETVGGSHLNSGSQSATRISSPNIRILDELLALGTTSRGGGGGGGATGQRTSNSSSQADNQSNITIIDYRQGAPINSTGQSSLLDSRIAANTSDNKSQERRSTFDQFASQFKSSLGLGDRRRSRQGVNNEPVPQVGLQQTGLHGLVPPLPQTMGNVKILDIRRTKTNRRRPKQSCANRLSRDYENVMPCQLARDDDYDDDEELDDDDDKHHTDNTKDRPDTQSDHLQADTTARIKNQPKQQQRQQSGETLSSFESDYDLLVYLGETETEDLVETERSLDYLDQTWRQSICGGASLAPTIDESLSELLQTPQSRFGGSSPRALPVESNDDFDQLWTQTNTTGSRARGHQQQQDTASTLNYRTSNNSNRLTPVQQQNRGAQSNLLADLSYGNINQTRWSTSLPRSQIQHNSGQLPSETNNFAQTQVKRPRGRETRGQGEELAHAPHGQLDKQPNHQAQSLAGNIGNKLASLFKSNQTRQQQQTGQSSGEQTGPSSGLTKQEAETVRQLNEFLEQARLGSTPMEAPQKPRRHQGSGGSFNKPLGQADEENANELDRLLAEMSQSLDLDSLARYDPHSRGAQQQQQRQTPANSRQQQFAAVPTASRPVVGERAAAQRRQSPSKTTGARQTKAMERNEFILNEYDGASRMLEQMINDQLDEALLVTGKSSGGGGGGSDPAKSRSKVSPLSTDRSGGRTSDEDRNSPSTSKGRKISSTCSTTTETSVVPSTSRGRPQIRTIPIELSEPTLKNQPQVSSGARESVRRRQIQMAHQMSLDAPATSEETSSEQNRKPLNYSRSLEEADPEVGVLIERMPPAESTIKRTITTEARPLTPPVSSKSSTSSMEAADEDDGRDVPPPPPVVDYNDYNENENNKTNFDKQNSSSQRSSMRSNALRESISQENQFIQVEPNELPNPTSSDDEQSSRRPISSGRHKRVMNQMKRRTMSGVRSVRQHLGRHFQGGASTDASSDQTDQTTTAANNTQPERGHTNPIAPARSSSIGSSTRSVSGSRRLDLETKELGAESPRQSRQRSRRTLATDTRDQQVEQRSPVEVAGGRKSFGQQIRDRLSRSKSRLSQFLRPLSVHRQQQAAATSENQHEEVEKQSEVPLFQPSDIARNEPVPLRGGESSLERQLKAEMCQLVEPKSVPGTSRKRSPSGQRSHGSDKSLGSGDLSGLETVTSKNRSERLFENLPLGRKSSKRKSRQTKRSAHLEPDKSQQKRPSSLMSLKRFGESFGRIGGKSGANEIGNSAEDEHDLEQQLTNGAAAAVHQKRAARIKRLRNRSTGDQQNSPDDKVTATKSVTPSRATTDDYFGFKAPIKTSPVVGSQQVAAKSLEVHQRVEMGPRVRPASAMVTLSDQSGQALPEHVVVQHRLFGKRRQQRVAPNRSQSLKGSDFAGARPKSGDATGKLLDSLDQTSDSRQKSVSFQNLADDQLAPLNQRRPLSPISPNTFRPVSASPGQELDKGRNLSPIMSETRRGDAGAITPIQLTPILSNHTQATSAPTAPARAQSPQQATAASKRDRGSALLQDLRNKCTDLFGPNNNKRCAPKEALDTIPTQQQVAATTSTEPADLAAPPSRPPRSRKRRDPAQLGAETRSKSLVAPTTLSVIELEPASPPPASPFAAASESPDSFRHVQDTPRRATVKRLANFAQQLKTSAADFFAAGPAAGQPRQATTSRNDQRLAARRPTTLTSSTTTVESRPHFRNLDEPLLQRDLAQWRPIIPIGGQKRNKVVRRSSSFRLAKDDNDQSETFVNERSQTLAGGNLMRSERDERDDDSCSDSTWDSSSNEDDDDDNDDEDRTQRPANRSNLQRRAHGRTKATRPDESSPARETVDGKGQQVALAIGSSRRAGWRATNGNEQMRAAASAASSSSNVVGTNNKKNDQDQNNNNRNSFQANLERNLRHLQPSQSQHKTADKTTGQQAGANLNAPTGSSVTKLLNENSSCKRLPGSNTSDCLLESHKLAPVTREQVEHFAQSCSLNERAFKFNENLPSPSQILSEIKRDSDESESGVGRQEANKVATANLGECKMTATRNTRRGRVVSSSENQLDGGTKSQGTEQARDEQDNEANANRLSIYENVHLQEQFKLPTPPRESASKLSALNQNLDGNQQHKEKQLASKNNANQLNEVVCVDETNLVIGVEDDKKPKRPLTRLKGVNLMADDENGQQDDWSVEPVDQLQAARNLKQRQQVAETKSGAEKSRELIGGKSVVESEQPTTKSSISSKVVPPAQARRAERKLVSMTSIIHEPEDELMNLKTSNLIVASNESASEQNSPSASTGNNERRRQSNFSFQNGISDNDDSESSLSLGCGRRRLENKLTRQRDKQEHSRLKPKPPVPSRPPNLPRATGLGAGSGGGGGGSLVRRLAKNFDQAAQQQPDWRGAAGASRTNVAVTSHQSVGNRPSPQQQDLVDEPKSDSTWYDAKSVELLDEAEVAELLREFENEGQDQTTQLQSDSDQYVTLSQDQPGRRDAADERGRQSGGGGCEDDDDDATLNDDETLNDANDDDDGDLLDASNGHEEDEEESVYLSAATHEKESLQRASRDGAGGSNNDCQSRLDVGSTSDDEKLSRVLLVGGADRLRHPRRDAAADVCDGDERLRGGGGGGGAACGGDEREACASGCGDGGHLLEQRVSAQTVTTQFNDDTTRQQTTNENANLKPMPTASCVSQLGPSPSSHKSTPATNTTLVKQTNDEIDQMKEIQLDGGQVGDNQLQDRQLLTGRLFRAFDTNKTPLGNCQPSGEKFQDEPASNEPLGQADHDNELDDEVDEDDDDEESSSVAINNINSEHSSSCRDDLISLSSSSLSSESMPELRQRKNLQRLYNIVNEICTSEEKFLATLSLLNEDFRRHILLSLVQNNSPNDAQSQTQTDLILLQQPPFDCIGLAMKHLPQLQALNQNLYDELRQARSQWPSTQKISHVLVKIGPFLKHYSSYIRDFECIQQQFQENMKKSSQFRETIKKFESDEAQKCCHLSIQHHLLKPIQRIPQYRLLLQQYLHHLKPDDADYEDTVSALEVVSRVAEHANQSLSEGANFAKLLSLQAKIVGGKQRDIIQPGRLFIREGELLKVCRKQIQPRWFVLLSDALFYLKQIQSNDILYLKYELPLDDCQVELPKVGQPNSASSGPIKETKQTSDGTQPVDEPEQVNECELNICTTVRSMTLIAKNRQERDDWFQALKSAIESHVAKRRSFKAGQQQQQLDLLQEPFNGLIGRKAPIWTPDSRVNTCQLCTSNFSALFRRHHCRACGRVVCSACSSNKAPLIYLKCRAARVCDQCFESLRANMHLYYLPSCQIDERELRRLDEHFKMLLKSQFVKKRMFASSKAPKVILLKGPNTKGSKSAPTDLMNSASGGAGSKE